MNKKFLVAALSLFTLISGNVLRANAKSCPNRATFGRHAALSVDKNLQSQLEITYFTTDDPNVFISEKAGLYRSPSSTRMSAKQFTAKLEKLAAEGVASIKKQQAADVYLGEMAELNLERNAADGVAMITGANLTTPGANYIFGLDRETDVSVYQVSPKDGYYHLSLLSWFVSLTAGGARKTVDYDANILLQPGETVVLKLMSDMEVKRSGAARSHMAVTLHSVNRQGIASLEGQASVTALRE
jgi:hypothetical protein